MRKQSSITSIEERFDRGRTVGKEMKLLAKSGPKRLPIATPSICMVE